MTTAEIWAEVAGVWTTIQAIRNRPMSKLWESSSLLWTFLSMDRGQLQKGLSRNVAELEKLTAQAIWNVERVTKAAINYIDGTLREHIDWIKSMILPNLKDISDLVERAIKAIDASGGVSQRYVDDAIYDATRPLIGEINALNTTIGNLNFFSRAKVKGLITEAEDRVYGYIDDEIEILEAALDVEVLLLEARIDDVVTTAIKYIDDKEDEIYAYLVSRFRYAKAYIDNEITKLKGDVAINMQVLESAISEGLVLLEGVLDKRRQKLVEDIGVALVNLELHLGGQIFEVQARVSTLASTGNWRAGFFDIFRSTPELSFLQVLLRDEAKFAEFKPYWQALFTRVMSED